MLVIFIVAVLTLALVVANMTGWPRVSPHGGARAGSVSILIPARNEARHIEAAIGAALSQSDVVREVLIYDDHSTDGTADLVRAAARDDRVRLIPPQPLPPGWCGKPFACTRLVAEARGEWLLFLDADAQLQPGAAGRIAAEAERRGATLLSCWPGLVLRSFWERALMPMLNHVVFTLFPVRLSLTSNMPALGLAHGACLLVRRAEYEQTGGHAMVREELFEDTALARAWRAAGLRSLCLDGQDVVRVRMYESLAGIWIGFQKNAYPAFRREASFWLFLVYHFTVFVLPFVVAPASIATGATSWPAWGAAAAALLIRTAQAIRFRYPLWSPLLHPFAEAGLIALALTSWGKCRAGAGIEWKGRTYRGRRP